MAKKAKVNKTQTVLAYLKAHADAGNKEVSEALGKKGITVTPGHVANIKAKAGIKRARKAVGKRLLAHVTETPAAAPEAAAAEKPVRASDMLTLEHVKAVARTVKTIGGFERLNELLGVIKEVGGIRRFKELLDAMAVPEGDTGKIPF